MSSISKQELKEILAKVKTFLHEEIYKIEKDQHGKSWFKVKPFLDEARQKVKKLGLWLPQIEKEYGGLGLSVAQFGEVSEILGASPYGHYCFNCQAPDAGNMEILIEFGTPEQKEKYLKPLLNGDIRSCFAMTEPHFAGSNPVNMGTMAVKEGDEYVINGHKWFTSSADGASFAIVMAISQPDNENRYGKASQIIVPTDTKGFDHIRNIPVMGTAGEGHPSHAEIKFNDCRVPLTNVLGIDGGGFTIAQKRLGPGRIHHCMRWIGICERALDMMCKRAVSRELRPGVRLADKQTVQNWIAESRAEINAARFMVRDAAQKIDEVGSSAARIEISTIKFFCANVLQQVVDRSIQVHGALGITDDTWLATWYGHERGARIYDGADEVHKSRVARMILKNY